jgi:hypothetical protein
MQHIIGISLGALVSYVLLLLFDGGRIISDTNTAYLTAVIAGAIVAGLWPWLIGMWLVRRHRGKQEAQVQAEVAKQVQAQGGSPKP